MKRTNYVIVLPGFSQMINLLECKLINISSINHEMMTEEKLVYIPFLAVVKDRGSGSRKLLLQCISY